MFENDQAIFQFLKRNVYVAVICDALDTLGYRNQAMHSRLRPLLPDIHACGFAGRARTLQWQLTDLINEEDPYGLELEAMDSLKPGGRRPLDGPDRKLYAVGRTHVNRRQAQWRRGFNMR